MLSSKNKSARHNFQWINKLDTIIELRWKFFDKTRVHDNKKNIKLFRYDAHHVFPANIFFFHLSTIISFKMTSHLSQIYFCDRINIINLWKKDGEIFHFENVYSILIYSSIMLNNWNLILNTVRKIREWEI